MFEARVQPIDFTGLASPIDDGRLGHQSGRICPSQPHPSSAKHDDPARGEFEKGRQRKIRVFGGHLKDMADACEKSMDKKRLNLAGLKKE